MWNADKSVRSSQLARTFYLTRLEPSSQRYFFDELVSYLVGFDWFSVLGRNIAVLLGSSF